MIADFLKEALRFLILSIIRPVFRAVGMILSPVSRILFGWLDRRIERKLQASLERDIRTNLPFLFEKLGAKVIPNTRKYPRAFDYAVVTIEANQLLFRFVRGRDEFRVDVAPEQAANDWQEVGEVIASIKGLENPPRYYRFGDLGPLLESNLPGLAEALAKPEYSRLMSRPNTQRVRLTRL